MIQIQILNKKRGGVGEYVGRPSPLGNPFPLRDEGEREAVVARFRALRARGHDAMVQYG